MFDLARIQSETTVQQVESHPELPSTNTRALELAGTAGARLPLLVLAERQTAGRGRGAHRWWAAPGSLTFSVVWPWEDDQPLGARLALLSLAAGVAVAEACETIAPQLRLGLKWPNDVLLDDRKLGGILIEVPPRGLKRAVIGIGVNVNNALTAAPEELRAGATSLADAAGREFDLSAVLVGILQRLAGLDPAVGGRSAAVVERWRGRCVLTGRIVHLAAGARRLVGRCHGVDAGGALWLETPTGIERHVSGTIVRTE